MKSKPSHKLDRYYLITTLVVVAVGVLSSFYTYKQVSENTQKTLLKNAVSIASVFKVEDILTLTGTDADLNNPDYLSLKERFEKIPQVNEDVRFVYLWGYREGYPFFFLDSEPAESEDYSPPGQVYYEATELDHDLFLKKLPPGVEFSTDRWGTWLSSLAPIRDEATGEVAAVLGIDMSADKYFKTLYVYTAIPILATLFVLLLILTGFLLQKKEEEFISFKSELVAIASHEIRTPLTGISWLTENLLFNAKGLAEDEKLTIAKIKAKSDGLLTTINDLLDSALLGREALERISKHPIQLKVLFDVLAKNYELNLKEKNLKLSLPLTLEKGIISGDPDKISRMFSNILSNAIKYSKAGGVVKVGLVDDERSVTVSIKDDGIGIPPEDRERIFKGFFRSKNAKSSTQNGTGLGLYYVRQIADLHNGRVWLESKVGEGTTFYVELPKNIA